MLLRNASIESCIPKKASHFTQKTGPKIFVDVIAVNIKKVKTTIFFKGNWAREFPLEAQISGKQGQKNKHIETETYSLGH